jgi:large subunit ribosomal protein L17
MRHQNKVKKLGRTASERRSLLANLVCSLIEHKQIRTTVAKAKAVRPFAEKMVTLAKRGDLHARRQAVSFLYSKNIVKELFDVVAPAAANRQGGYTRITKLGPRLSDSAPMAYLEWVDQPAAAEATEAVAEAPAGKKKKPADKKPAAKQAAKSGKAAKDEKSAEEEGKQ